MDIRLEFVCILVLVSLPALSSLPHQRGQTYPRLVHQQRRETVVGGAHTSATQPRSLRAIGRNEDLAAPVIANGTRVTMELGHNGFVPCWTNTSSALLSQYQIKWEVEGEVMSGWTSDERRFTVGSGIHVPHLYLVFTRFSSDLAATYDCVLHNQGREVGRASVTVT